MFPELSGKRYCEIDLEGEAARWRGPFKGPNPLLDPVVCERMIAEIHRKRGVDWSYGGYLENRRELWRDSYLEASGNFVHLGVDFHVPQGTRVAADFAARVMLVDDDQDTEGGWGMRVFLRPAGELVFIYAHLQNVSCRPGQALQPGEVFCEVGGPPHNGNWMPHLHVQTIRAALFEEILVNRFGELDGYGDPNQLEILRRDYPDPLPHLSL